MRRSGEDVRGEEEALPPGEVSARVRGAGASGEGADVGLQQVVCLHRPRWPACGAARTRADGGGEARWETLPECYKKKVFEECSCYNVIMLLHVFYQSTKPP